VEPLVIVVKLDVFEELTPGLGPAADDLILWKTLCFQRAEECFHHRIIIAISYPTRPRQDQTNAVVQAVPQQFLISYRWINKSFDTAFVQLLALIPIDTK
jgi:hypothetical protein